MVYWFIDLFVYLFVYLFIYLSLTKKWQYDNTNSMIQILFIFSHCTLTSNNQNYLRDIFE